MTTTHLTPRSQATWAAQLLATAPDRAAIARKAGLTRATFSRMLACRAKVSDALARRLAELSGLAVIERSQHAFTMAVTP